MQRMTASRGVMRYGFDIEGYYGYSRYYEPSFHYRDPVERRAKDPRMQWAFFLYHAPIRVQLLYRTDSAVLVLTKDVWCGVLFVPRVDPRHPRTMGFLSADLDLAVLVVEV